MAVSAFARTHFRPMFSFYTPWNERSIGLIHKQCVNALQVIWTIFLTQLISLSKYEYKILMTLLLSWGKRYKKLWNDNIKLLKVSTLILGWQRIRTDIHSSSAVLIFLRVFIKDFRRTFLLRYLSRNISNKIKLIGKTIYMRLGD